MISTVPGSGRTLISTGAPAGTQDSYPEWHLHIPSKCRNYITNPRIILAAVFLIAQKFAGDNSVVHICVLLPSPELKGKKS